jgi:hypothetical protein
MAGNVYWGVHGALADNVGAPIMMIGDSWFWYPADNLAQEVGRLRPHRNVVVVGRNGAEAAQWSTRYSDDIDFAFKMYGSDVPVLLLSGGGNDLVGMKDFLRIVKEDCSASTTVEGCYRTAQPDALLTMVIGCYRTLITKFRAYNPLAPVILHQYDYAWPSGMGVFGPADWLKAPMDAAKIKTAKLQRELFEDLINRLKQAQIDLAAEPAMGRILVAESAGKLPNNLAIWANELHPTPEGFRMIAHDAIEPQLKLVPI